MFSCYQLFVICLSTRSKNVYFISLEHKNWEPNVQLYIFAQSSTRPTLLSLLLSSLLLKCLIDVNKGHVIHVYDLCINRYLHITYFAMMTMSTTRKPRSNYQLHHGTSFQRIFPKHNQHHF